MEAQVGARGAHRRAIGRVVVSGEGGALETGSAFIISRELALTAFHCVRASGSDEASDRPVAIVLGEDISLPAEVEAIDPEADAALLRLTTPLPGGWSPILLALAGEALRDVHFQSPGFPRDRPFTSSAVTADGEIVNPDGDTDGTPALELFCRQVAPGRDIHGFSGSPVLVRVTGSRDAGTRTGWAAVGLIRWAQPIPESERIGLGGTVYACPMSTLAGRWPALQPLADPDRLPASSEEALRRRTLRRYTYDFQDELEAGRRAVGREVLLSRIQAFAHGHLCGYVHVQASAGLGKSALAARFALLEQAPAFFADANRGTTRPDQCLNHLSAELVFRFGLEDDRVDDYSGRDASVLMGLLKEAAEAQEEPVWLVVDALDEADEPRPGANPLLLPARLPPGVFLLVTSREPASELFVLPGTPVEVVEFSSDEPWQRADLAAYVQSRLADPGVNARLGAAEVEAEAFAADLLRAADGNFMYVNYVLHDLAAGEITAAQLPSRLAGYYEVRFWTPMQAVREQGWEQWEQLYRPVLECLALAAEPVSAQWLAEQVGRSAEEITARVLTPWRRFLRSQRVAGVERWRIVHRSFGDFLASKFDLTQAHAALAARLLATRGDYARRHVSSHLRAARDTERLIELVRDATWRAEQQMADPTGQLFLQDLDEAWLAAEAADAQAIGAGMPAPFIGDELWCALAMASVRSELGAVPPALLGVLVEDGRWTLERALQTIRNSPDPAHRARALLELSRFDSSLLEEAVLAAQQITWPPVLAARVTAAIAEVLEPPRRDEVLAAQLETALQADELQAPYAAAELVPLLPEALLPRVVELARTAQYDTERAAVFTALAERIGPDVAADPIAREALARWLPESVVDAFAAEPGSAEAAAAARAAVDELEIEPGRPWFFSQRGVEWTIRALASRLDIDGLRICVAQARRSGGLAYEALEPLAEAFRRLGAYEDALDCLDEVGSEERARLLARLTPDLPRELQMRAVEIATAIDAPYDRGQAVGALARRLPPSLRGELIDLALAREPIADEEQQGAVLRGFARHLDADLARTGLAVASKLMPTSSFANLLTALIPALPEDQLALARSMLFAMDEERADGARAQLINRLSGDALLDEADLAVLTGSGSRVRLALARRLDDAGRDHVLRLSAVAAPEAGGAWDVLLALSGVFSDLQAERAAELLGSEGAGNLRALRRLCRETAEDSASGAELVQQAADAPFEIRVQMRDALIERGRFLDALEFIAALPESVRAETISDLAGVGDPELRQAAFDAAFEIGEWTPRMPALAALAAQLDVATVREACRRLDEEALLAVAQVAERYRDLALKQRRAAELPLRAELPAEERAAFRDELDQWLVAADWPQAVQLLRVIELSHPVPADMAAVLHRGWSRLLHTLALQPRRTLLRELAELEPVVFGMAGEDACRAVVRAASDACGQWT